MRECGHVLTRNLKTARTILHFISIRKRTEGEIRYLPYLVSIRIYAYSLYRMFAYSPFAYSPFAYPLYRILAYTHYRITAYTHIPFDFLTF